MAFAGLAASAAVAACIALGAVFVPLARLPPGVAFAVGKAGDFAPESVEPRELPATLENIDPKLGMLADGAAERRPGRPPWPVRKRLSPVPVYLAADEQGTLRAFYRRDPWSSCALPWQEAEGEFIDPCWGSHYTLSGDCVAGPCQRGLDRFAIERRLDGTLVVRVDRFEQGPPRTDHKQ